MKEYFTKKNLLIAGGILLLALLANNARAAEVGGYAGVQSDYIWRGMNQSNGPSAWAGVHVDTDAGLYGGAWISQVEFEGSEATEELDWYAGFSKSISGVELDVMYIDYGYRGDSNLDFEEGQIGVGLFDNKVKLSHYVGMDDALDYSEVELNMFKVADLSYGFISDVGSNWKISRSMELLGGEVELGYAEFLADDNSLLQDEDSFFLSYSRKLF